VTEKPEDNERKKRGGKTPARPETSEAFAGLIGGFRFGDAIFSKSTGEKFGGLLEDEKHHFYHTASQEEWERAFDAIGKGNEHLPIVPLEAFERDSLYEEHS
jgi:hypothetical protein